MLLYSGTKDGISGCREVSYVLHLCYNGGVLSFLLKEKKEPKKSSRLTFFSYSLPALR